MKTIFLSAVITLLVMLTGCRSPFSEISVLSFAPAELAFDKKTYFYGEVGVGSAAVTKFTLYNTSQVAAVGCEDLELSDDSNFSIYSTTCNQETMYPSSSCEVDILSEPQSLGPKALTLSRKCKNTNVSTTENQITAIAITPDLVWSPLVKDFGNIFVGSNSAIETFTLTNNSFGMATGCSDPVLVDSVNFQIVADTCGSNDLFGFSTCQVQVQANPQTTGHKKAHLYRTCTLGGTVSTTPNQIKVEGSLTNLAWAPQSFDFGSVNEGSATADYQFNFSNTGTANATFCGLPTLSDSTNFTITADTCGLNNTNVGGSCFVRVSGTPQSAGLFTTTLSRTCITGGVTSTQQDQIVVTGIALMPSLSWSPLNFDFGAVNLNNMSSSQVFSLSNSGNASATSCSAPTLSNATDFYIDSDLCGTADLSNGASCDVSVRALPQAAGLRQTTLSRHCVVGGITSTSFNQIIVTGQALPANWSQEFNLTNFNLVRSAGGHSNTFSYYFRNPNLVGLTGCSAPSLTNMTDFSIVNDSCGAGGMSALSVCEVKVQGNPLTIGAKNGQLTRTCSESGTTNISLNVTGGSSALVTALASNSYSDHGCALLSDGTVKCWGVNSFGQLGNASTTTPATPVLVSGITSATQVVNGRDHTCVLLADQTVKCFGYNLYGQLGDGTTTQRTSPVTVSGITNAIYIAAGSQYSCAVLSDNTIKCWGRNDGGQLGDGTTTNRSAPVAVQVISNAAQVEIDSYLSCALLTDSTIKCWGNNSVGQLGDGTTNPSAVPVSVVGISTATKLTVGAAHGCARLSDSTIQCWGGNSQKQLGDGTTTNRSSPVSVVGIANASSISANEYHTCALLSDQTMKCWGRNTYGQLGQGNFTANIDPSVVVGINSATQIITSAKKSCALLSDNTAKCWGENFNYSLGSGETTTKVLQQIVPGISTAVEVVTGQRHTCALLSGGTIQCWGDNQYGQLGNGTTRASVVPVVVTGISNATQIAGGGNHTCARLTDSTVKCWGDNSYGQLGDGTGVQQTSPVVVSGVSNAIQLTAGFQQSCSRLADNTIKCWGRNGLGGLGNGTTTQLYVPTVVSGISNALEVHSGSSFSCARLADSTVKCWGYNFLGQVGDGTTTTRLTPVDIGLTGVNILSVGNSHSCVYLADLSFKCWGYNASGQLGDGTTTDRLSPVTLSGVTSVVSINSSQSHTCILLANNKMQCWGSNQGQLGDGTVSTAFVNNNRLSPVYRLSSDPVISMSRGSMGSHQCLLRTTNDITCSGANEYSQSGWSELTPRTVNGL